MQPSSVLPSSLPCIINVPQRGTPGVLRNTLHQLCRKMKKGPPKVRSQGQKKALLSLAVQPTGRKNFLNPATKACAGPFKVLPRTNFTSFVQVLTMCVTRPYFEPFKVLLRTNERGELQVETGAGVRTAHA